jgi:hypothetical protein
MRLLTVMVRGLGMLPGGVVLTRIVVVGGFQVVMSGCRVMSGCLVMVLGCRVLGCGRHRGRLLRGHWVRDQ